MNTNNAASARAADRAVNRAVHRPPARSESHPYEVMASTCHLVWMELSDAIPRGWPHPSDQPTGL
jgi:hypothetical protein